jgi:hypothetical protein
MALGIAAAGCGPSFEMTAPAGFVEIDNAWDSYDYRATTADGLVIGVREIAHDPKGEASFWVKAIQNRMRERGGYALLETVEVTSGDGVRGTQMRFGHDEGGKHPHLYYLTLFVTSERLYLVEAGGTKELVTASAAELDRAIKAFRTR